MKENKLLSLCVSTGKYSDFVQSIIQDAKEGKSAYACLANVHMLIEAYKSFSFARRVNNAAMITPDGKPLAWALRLLYGIRQERVAGMDLLPDLLEKAETDELPVFFYGGSEKMLQNTRNYVEEHYPALRIAGTISPPFRQLTFKEERVTVEKINTSGARIVFIVLGCPKQEKWMAAMQGRINAFMVGIGGALPVLIGMQKRAPKWMQACGMEWFYRLAQEPKRLFGRYAVTNSIFLYLFLKTYMQQKLQFRASKPFIESQQNSVI